MVVFYALDGCAANQSCDRISFVVKEETLAEFMKYAKPAGS